MNENETHKLIGKLSGAVVFLGVVVIGLVIAILVLFAFQTQEEEKEEELLGCGVVYPDPHGRTHDFVNGERLFNQNCASCHFVNKDMTGPAIKGARERGWENSYENWIYDFIRKEDSLVQIEDAYTLKLREDWNWSDNSWSHNFPLTHSEIDDLMDYAY